MGTQSRYEMKVLLAVSALLGLAVATALAKYLTSEESMARQVEILLADVCPSTENPDDCVARLPDFWMQVGAVLWPGYYDPTADWMCATDDICGAPEFKKRLSLRDFTCEQCIGGIQDSIDQMLSEDFIAGIVEALSGDIFCDQSENAEECANVIAALIPVALPALAKAGAADTTTGPMICNSVMEGVCA